MEVKFIKCFFCIYWDDHKIFILYFAMWCIKLTDLQMLNHPSTPRIDPIWSQYTILLMYCWVWFADILLRISVSMFIRDTGLQFSCGILVWFCYNGIADLLDSFRRVLSSSIFERQERVVLALFWLLGTLHQWRHLVLDFCFLGAFLLWTSNNFVQIFCCIMIWSW